MLVTTDTQSPIPEKIQASGPSKPEAVYQPLKDDVYHNMTMISPEGKVLCRCGPKKVNWYLSRGLAKVVSEDPLVIQLNFEPAGKGEDGDAYQLAEKDNNCVVCGRDDYNTKHHIVEYEYRQHMPVRHCSSLFFKKNRLDASSYPHLDLNRRFYDHQSH